MTSKRIIIMRHGEKPDKAEFTDDENYIGLTNQGAIRAFMMPTIVKNIIGSNPYSFYTYTHIINTEPTARSYYTGQLLSNRNTACDTSDEIDKLVQLVTADPSEIIIICWIHTRISDIINALIGISIDFDTICSNIYNNLPDEKTTVKIKLDQISAIQYCANNFLSDNLQGRDYDIKKKKDIEYALVFDIDYINKSYQVYPNIIIEADDKKTYSVKMYV